MARKTNKQDIKRETIRESLWPGSSAWIWNPSEVVGFATVPRLLPWILHLIKQLADGSDPSPVYLELWCRDFGQGIISITDEQKSAYAAGYASTRAHRTWREHMFKLVELGFILARKEGLREFGQVLLLNPLGICQRLHQEGKVPDEWWAAFVSRAQEIGAGLPGPLIIRPLPLKGASDD